MFNPPAEPAEAAAAAAPLVAHGLPDHQAALGEALAAVAPAAVAAAAPAPAAAEPGALPLIGRRPALQQQRVLLGMVVGGAMAFVLTGVLALNAADRQSSQIAVTGQALMQSQRLAKSVSQALIGSPAAFPELQASGEVLARNLRGLAGGNDQVAAVPAVVQESLAPLMPLLERRWPHFFPPRSPFFTLARWKWAWARGVSPKRWELSPALTRRRARCDWPNGAASR